MNSKYMDEEAGTSKYAYFVSTLGLVRVEIFDIEQKPKYEMGLVLRDESFEIPDYAGVFCHNNIIYVVGGLLDIMTDKHNDFLLKFDHNEFQKFPHTYMAGFQFLEKSHINYAPMMVPDVIPAGDTTYFLHDTYLHLYPEAFGFQSFNAQKNCFEKLPNPPVPRPPPDRDPSRGLFLVGSCIYLFVTYRRSPSSIYTFDPLSKQWKKNESLESQFLNKNIPAPLDHKGDVVLSDECPHDKTRILVALHLGRLIAYRVRFVEGWESFDLISFRFLEESHIPDRSSLFDPWTHLTDFGGRRFCVIRGSERSDFLMYVVSIDFEEEHQIQELKDSESKGSEEYRIQELNDSESKGMISSSILSSEEHQIQEFLDSESKGMISSTILSSEVFDLERLKDLPPHIHPRVRAEVCFLAAPPVTRNSSRKDAHKMTSSSAPPASPAKKKYSTKDGHKMTSSSAPPASPAKKKHSRKGGHKMTSSSAPPASPAKKK